LPFALTALADRSVAYAQEVDANIKCEAEGRQATLAPNAAPVAPAALCAGPSRDGEAAVHMQEAPQAQVKAEAEKAARAAESEVQEHEKRAGTATEAARAAGEKAAQQVILACEGKGTSPTLTTRPLRRPPPLGCRERGCWSLRPAS
jgi:hypothetical protein